MPKQIISKYRYIIPFPIDHPERATIEIVFTDEEIFRQWLPVLEHMEKSLKDYKKPL